MRSFFIITSITYLLVNTLSAQIEEGPINTLVNNLTSYSRNYAPDKVYLHTDKNLYGKHETIWYAAYLLDGVSHIPGTESDVINVELRNKNGEVLNLQELYAPDGFAHGNFKIEDDWLVGQYSIVGYTNYMLGDDKEYLFQKTINISTVEKLDSLYTTHTIIETASLLVELPKPEVNFYPEGGDLIDNVKTRIGVKINSTTNESFTGKVFDSANNLVAQFKTYKFGYGLIDFTPDINEEYTVTITLADQSFNYELPIIKPSGISLNILNKRKKFFVQIKASDDINISYLFLVSHVRGKVLLVKSLKEFGTGSEVNIQLSKSEFPDGVVQFTIFDQECNPICERLSFVENDINNLDIQYSTSIANPGATRSEVNLNLELNSLLDSIKSIHAKLSLAVVESTANSLMPSQTNIKSWLLLNSELRGEIKDAAYFFKEPNIVKRDYILDILLITHGWRRFDWSVMKSAVYSPVNKNIKQQGLFIKGQTTKWLKKKKGVKSNVNLVFLDNKFTEENAVTDDNGYFEFGPFVSKDTLSAIVQVRKYNEKKKGKLEGKKTVNINLFNEQNYVALEQKDNYYLKEENAKVDQSKYMQQAIYSENIYAQENMMSVELDEFVVTAKSLEKESEVEKLSRKLSIYLNPSKRLIPKNNDRISAISVFDLIRRIPGVRVSGSFPGVNVSIGGPSSFSGSGTPLFLYNGAVVDLDFIGTISPVNVIFIDVLNGAEATIFGSRGGNGVIAVYTGRTQVSVTKKTPGITDFKFNGFYQAAEFYSPDYSMDFSENDKPDYRSTLYWNPNLLLNQDESQTFRFYTTDEPTNKYKVVLEGVTGNGSLIYKEFDLE